MDRKLPGGLILLLIPFVPMWSLLWVDAMDARLHALSWIMMFIAVLWVALTSHWVMAYLRARRLGSAIRFDREGVWLPDEPLLPWRFVRSVRWDTSLDIPCLCLRIAVGPDFVRWRPWYRSLALNRPRLQGDWVRISTLGWRYNDHADWVRILLVVRHVAPHVETWHPSAARTPAAHTPRAIETVSVEGLREVDQAREAAVALIQSGARASDPALKAAWARYDALRESTGRPSR